MLKTTFFLENSRPGTPDCRGRETLAGESAAVLQETPASVKDSLRAHLARRCAEDELRSWYDPLQIAMHPEERGLVVTFPHHLFGLWFAQAGKHAFESCLASCLGKMPVHYRSRQGQNPPPSPPAPNFAEKAQPFGEQFSLENFLANEKNVFPLAVAREAATRQQTPAYNPLVYYGKSGSGKTHLLRAVANALSAAMRPVFYGSTAEWTQLDEQSGALETYHAYCIDDLHLLSKDFSMQEKFLLFLDACLEGQKQFVCACAGPPATQLGLSEGLRSRLSLGLIVRLKSPDIDVRMRFAKEYNAIHEIGLTKEYLLLLAQRCEHLRYLSGILLKIAAYKKFAQRDIVRQDIEKILKNSGEHAPVTPQDIIRQVAAHFSLTPEAITGSTRKPPLVFARQMAMYLCREILGSSYPVLGQIFGGKNHSTVIYSIKKIEKYIVTHKEAHTEFTELMHKCMRRDD